MAPPQLVRRAERARERRRAARREVELRASDLSRTPATRWIMSAGSRMSFADDEDRRGAVGERSLAMSHGRRGPGTVSRIVEHGDVRSRWVSRMSFAGAPGSI